VTDVGDEVLLTEEQIHAFRERHDLVGKGARDDGYQGRRSGILTDTS
jgi:hypothetical protein